MALSPSQMRYRSLISAEQEGTAFVADRHEAWRETLCVVEARTVANDNTIAWNGRRLQLPESRLRPHFVKAVVRVHAYPDGKASVFLSPHRLATFDAHGLQIIPDAGEPGRVPGAAKGKASRARGAVRGGQPERQIGRASSAVDTRRAEPDGTAAVASLPTCCMS